MNKTLFPQYAKFVAYIIFASFLFMPLFIWLGTQNSISASHYHIKTNNIISLKGVIIMLLTILQITVAIGVIKDKLWAIILGLLDATIGIACYLLFTIKQFVYYNPAESREVSSGIIFLIIYFSLMYKLYNRHLRNTDILKRYIHHSF